MSCKYLKSHILLLYLCFNVLFSCKEKCSEISVPEIKQVLFAAYENPETFDDFVSANRDLFNSDFMECFNNNLDMMRAIEEDEREICDDAHVFGSDFWHQCHNEVDQNYGNAVAFNTAILNAINGVRSFGNSDAGKTLIAMKLLFPQDYSFMINFLKSYTNEIAVKCESCEKVFFLS